MPPGLAQEQHRDGHARGEDHGVVSGAAGHPVDREAGGSDRARQRVDQARVAGGSGLIRVLPPVYGDATAFSDALGRS